MNKPHFSQIFLILVFFFFLTLLHAEEEIVNGMAAIVNNDVITFSQVRELAFTQEQAAAASLQGKELEEKIKQLRQAAIKDLIDSTLIMQDFKKKEFTIPEYMVDEAVQKIIRQEFGGDRMAFVKALQAQGYSVARFRQVQKDRIIVQALRNSKVKDNYVISPVKVHEFYEKNRTAYTTPEQVKLRMIVLHGDSNAGSNSSKKGIADEIRQKISEGAEFDRMAQMYSEDSTQDSGGDWGWIERKTLKEELSKMAFSMKAGEVSPVILLDNSYYILMIEAKKTATVKPLSELQREIEQGLIDQEKMKAQERWLKGLRDKAYIKIL